MLTLASAILSLTPLIAEEPPVPHGRLPVLPFVWEQRRILERQPNVRLWFRGDNLFRHGDYADVYYRTDEDAYVMIVRIDTDGRLDILYPTHRDDYHLARGGRTYHVPTYDRGSFYITDDPGMGYIFAVASWEPFDLDRIAYGRSSAYRYAGRRIHGDPFDAVQDLADDLLGDRYGYYALDHVAYYVNRRYEYPRYLCYNCHGYRSYSRWNPYAHRCVNFRIVIYNDPYYYPYRYSRGSRVIYVRDTRRPRYEFKEHTGRVATSDPYIDYRFRGDNVDRRRPGSPAEDPNLPRRATASSAGATRPGDDVSAGSTGGRRVVGRSESASPGPDGRLPRRDGDGRAGDERGPRRGIDERDERLPEVRSPRREAGQEQRDERAPERSPRREAREEGSGGLPEVRSPRREPERESSSRYEPLPGSDSRTPRRAGAPEGIESDSRGVEPRREPERRSEPRVVEPRREPERRAEPQRAPERRSEPERRAEPRREPERRAEPQRAPERREPSRASSPERSSSGSSVGRRKP